MSESPALETPLPLRLLAAAFLAVWSIVAVFPLGWIAVMSFRQPLDAFSPNPFVVFAGPNTLASSGGVSYAGFLLACVIFGFGFRFVRRNIAHIVARVTPGERAAIGWLLATLLVATASAAVLILLLPLAMRILDGALAALPLLSGLAKPTIGLTFEHYREVWVVDSFHQQFLNTMLITCGVVTISLSVGTLAGYAFARTPTRFAFWLLIIALVFRALPHSVLVAGYLPAFISSRETLQPLWDSAFLGPLLKLFAAHAPTLYGQPWAVIFVMVAINQPFTIWLLRSFFINIPKELDEAAMVDGCTPFGAFRRVIIPVMWPGVITTGLFSFLLAYNDYLVAAVLLDAQSQTMVPTITQYMNSETKPSDQLRAVAAAVSITAPLFLLVLVFQRQIVAGLVKGAVKG